jgi:hypothetical protein
MKSSSAPFLGISRIEALTALPSAEALCAPSTSYPLVTASDIHQPMNISSKSSVFVKYPDHNLSAHLQFLVSLSHSSCIHVFTI